MLNYAIPFIEKLANDEKISDNSRLNIQIQERREIARVITDYLHKGRVGEEYYSALGQLLAKSEYQRAILYLPLTDIESAPDWFREIYLDAWYMLLNVQDARENFYEGDTFEVGARPNGYLERVVKCVHLTPWLIDAGYLDYTSLRRILELNQDDKTLLRSFANIWQILDDQKLLAKAELRHLKESTAQISQRAQIEPLYISEKRKEWLRKRKNSCNEVLLTPNANLAGPFSPNMKALMDDLEAIQRTLSPKEIVLVGGSRLKGYGTISSDLDVFRLEELNRNVRMKAGSPHAAHIYLNTLWLGGSKVNNLDVIAADYAMAYFKSPDRHLAIERLESDLLQYRLLHKGFTKFYGRHNSIAKDYAEIDGNCPFYDDKYRRIATELFAKYVFIPVLST